MTYNIEFETLTFTMEPGEALTSPAVLRDHLNKKVGWQECFYVVPTDIKNRQLKVIELYRGGMAQCHVSICDTLRAVLLAGGVGFFIAHNHPSGDYEPSEEDHKLTASFKKAAETVGLKLTDHIILTGGPDYYSYMESGKLSFL